MKISEVPESILTSFRLLTTPKEKLGLNAQPASEATVVSLTSIPSRIATLHLTIRSLLDQDVQPERTVLWLHHSLKDKIPRRLSKLQGDAFEIHFCDQTCAHRKLVETLKIFPNKIIVTCDDDGMYPTNWLRGLLDEHANFPQDVIANECRVIAHEGGEPLPYKDWKSEEAGHGSARTLATGYSGILYPPHCIHEDVTNTNLYGRLAPKADDLWFKAMTLRKDTITRRSSIPCEKPTPILFSQRVSLKRHNVERDGNREQWAQLVKYYGLEEFRIRRTSAA